MFFVSNFWFNYNNKRASYITSCHLKPGILDLKIASKAAIFFLSSISRLVEAFCFLAAIIFEREKDFERESDKEKMTSTNYFKNLFKRFFILIIISYSYCI